MPSGSPVTDLTGRVLVGPATEPLAQETPDRDNASAPADAGRED